MRVLIAGPDFKWTGQLLDQLKRRIQRLLPPDKDLTLLYRSEPGGSFVAVEIYLDGLCDGLEIWAPGGFEDWSFGSKSLNDQHVEFSQATDRETRRRLSLAVKK